MGRVNSFAWQQKLLVNREAAKLCSEKYVCYSGRLFACMCQSLSLTEVEQCIIRCKCNSIHLEKR